MKKILEKCRLKLLNMKKDKEKEIAQKWYCEENAKLQAKINSIHAMRIAVIEENQKLQIELQQYRKRIAELENQNK